MRRFEAIHIHDLVRTIQQCTMCVIKMNNKDQ
ncbi:hypothetical protein SETIT_7G067500v2 [Setaria italica]|uniref:Uncharacterized protein n=1 Tax=Setaria italica TaxID=4555 RepID=A0A368RSX4_SETIT|nr:hypothetical protein SETIT_7G067500v2 [Setaria italica]